MNDAAAASASGTRTNAAGGNGDELDDDEAGDDDDDDDEDDDDDDDDDNGCGAAAEADLGGEESEGAGFGPGAGHGISPLADVVFQPVVMAPAPKCLELVPPQFLPRGMPGLYDESEKFKGAAWSFERCQDDEGNREPYSMMNKREKSHPKSDCPVVTFKAAMAGNVPAEPGSAGKKKNERNEDANKSLRETTVSRAEKLLAERPMWTRRHFLLRLNARRSSNDEVRHNEEVYLLNALTYKFKDGPWRGFHVRLGFNPVVDRSACMYQRLEVRMPYLRREQYSEARDLARDLGERDATTGAAREPDAVTLAAGDGAEMLHTLRQLPRASNMTYQLCDFLDDDLQEVLQRAKPNDEDDVVPSIGVDGWFAPGFIKEFHEKIIARADYTLSLFLFQHGIGTEPRALTPEEMTPVVRPRARTRRDTVSSAIMDTDTPYGGFGDGRGGAWTFHVADGAADAPGPPSAAQVAAAQRDLHSTVAHLAAQQDGSDFMDEEED